MFKQNATLRSSLLLGAVGLMMAAPASAQRQDEIETVTVTGTLIQGNANLVSPITVLDQTTLDERGFSSIETALQNTLANNGPAITNSWTANGNFAQGASAVSLRGLTTNSTLILFDGMRAAYYPLSDDGTRNFVDLNTIADDIVDNIQILRDGASSAYGADAIAGVVNIITKREFQGLSARAEGGIADRGDAAQWKFSVTAGVGDLSKDKVNFYVSASYFHSDVLMMRSRPYPFNSSDWTNVCYQGTCGSEGGGNGYINHTHNADDSLALGTGGQFLVRPYGLSTGTDGHYILNAITGSRWQPLQTGGCSQGGTLHVLTAEEKANLGAANPDQVCQYDVNKLWGSINPSVTRFSLTGHTAFELPKSISGYIEANFMQDQVGYPYLPNGFVRNANTGVFFPRFSSNAVHNSTNALESRQLFLPEYICPERVNCDTSPNRQLNPYNPWAGTVDGSGRPIVARVYGSDLINIPFESTRDRTYRVAGELNGVLPNDWRWTVSATAMHIDLRREDRGFIYIQHLLDVIADGTYNFINPAATPQSVIDYMTPLNVSDATSDMAEAKAAVTAPLVKLPGGDLTVVVGGSVRYEAVDAPSANLDRAGATERYFVQNAFGTKGSRDVYSTYFEVNAPVMEMLTLNASGRYDNYSSGQSNFSPKFGIWFRPIDQITLKGTYSEGFRIPSFAESNALPTTGYVGNTRSMFTDAYLAQYGCSTRTSGAAPLYSACPAYITGGAVGETKLATPNLDPEKSRSWVFDLTLQPTDEITITATYYNIKKTGAITGRSYAAAWEAYYAGEPIPAGYNVIPDAPDPVRLTATPRIAFVETNLVNANSIRTSGFDFGITYGTDLSPVEDMLGVTSTIGPVQLASSAQATFIQNLDTKFPDGTIQRFDGTLGNNDLTAGTGTPKWRGTWQNTFIAGMYEFTSTLNWNSGYNVSAMDQGNLYRECGLPDPDHAGQILLGMNDGSIPCRTADYFTWDVNLQVHITSSVTAYLTVLNALDAMPPVDTVATYAITGYNVVVGGDGILGRYLKLGVKVDL